MQNRLKIRKNHFFKNREASLDITPFMNLMVVLIPFLLSGLVFSRLAILELELPKSHKSEMASKPTREPFRLIITLYENNLTVQGTGLDRTRIPLKEGKYNIGSLASILTQVKQSFPDENSVIILSEPEVAYQSLVEVMDASRSGPDGGLFPVISIGEVKPS